VKSVSDSVKSAIINGDNGFITSLCGRKEVLKVLNGNEISSLMGSNIFQSSPKLGFKMFLENGSSDIISKVF
jgi:hypothetical protein